jgi:hypothetical protein
MTEQDVQQLSEDLELSRRIRRNSRNTLGARCQLTLLWGAVMILAGYTRDCAPDFVWLLVPVLLAAAIATMIAGARLRFLRGELNVRSEKTGGIIFGATGLIMSVLFFTLRPGPAAAALLTGLLAAAHLAAGIRLESSYFVTSVTLAAGFAFLLASDSALIDGYPMLLWGAVSAAALLTGAVIGKAVHCHAR